MDTQESQDKLPEALQEAIDKSALQLLDGDELPWVWNIAAQVYRSKSVRRVFYIRAVIHLLSTIAVAAFVNPIVAAILLAYQLYVEKEYLERQHMRLMIYGIGGKTAYLEQMVMHLGQTSDKMGEGIMMVQQRMAEIIANKEGLADIQGGPQ